MGAFAVQVAGNGLATKVIYHPTLCVLSGSGPEFRRIHAVQSDGRSIDHNGVGITDVNSCGGQSGNSNG